MDIVNHKKELGQKSNILQSYLDLYDNSNINPSIISDIKHAYSKGFNFLVQECHNGLFPSFCSRDPQMIEIMESPAEAAAPALALNHVFRHYLDHPTSKAIINYMLKHLDAEGKYPFFDNPELLETETETTSYVLSVLLELGFIDMRVCLQIVQAIKKVIRPDGILSIYFDPPGGDHRIDHVSATNTLFFLYLINEIQDFSKTENWILQQLNDGGYKNGSRYYPSPDTFFYFLSRLCNNFPLAKNKYIRQVNIIFPDRIGSTKNPLEIAMRMTTARRLGFPYDSERALLLEMQLPDGSWPAAGLFKYGTKDIFLGSPSITTSFALEALGLS